MMKLSPQVALLLIIGFGNCHAALSSVEVWKPLTVESAAAVNQPHGRAQTDKSYANDTLTIAGTRYDRGIGTHAPSELIFALEGKRHKFTALVGMDDKGGPTASAQFKVLLDGREVFASGPKRAGEPATPVTLDVSKVKELRLITEDIGNGLQGDHADWANVSVDDQPEAKPVPEFSTAGFFPVNSSPRTVQNFGPGWRFKKGAVSGAEAPAYDDSAWEAANLPHGLEVLRRKPQRRPQLPRSRLVSEALRHRPRRRQGIPLL